MSPNSIAASSSLGKATASYWENGITVRVTFEVDHAALVRELEDGSLPALSGSTPAEVCEAMSQALPKAAIWTLEQGRQRLLADLAQRALQVLRGECTSLAAPTGDGNTSREGGSQ